MGLGQLRMPILGRKSKLLAISLGESSLTVAQLTPDGGNSQQVKTGEFVLGQDLSFDRPEALGAALGAFLRLDGFSARGAVLGLPARWLIYKSHVIPPADQQTTSEMLWLYATEQASPELGPMVFDFFGTADEEHESRILLAGLQQRRLNAVQVMARAAGLELQSVVPTGLALAAASAKHVDCPATLWLRRDGAEFIPADPLQTPRFIAKDRMAAEFRRIAAERIALWSDTEIEPGLLEKLNESAAVSRAKADWVNLSQCNPCYFSPVVLAGASISGQTPRIDFLHSKLTAPRPQRASRASPWAVAAAAAVILIAIAAVADMTMIHTQIADTDQQLATIDPAVKTAKPFLAGASFVESFRKAPPRYLACLRDLTAATSTDPQTSFVSFHMKSDLTGELSGKSSAEQNVLGFIDRLNASGAFADVKCKLDANPPASGNGVTFALTFNYRPAH